MTNPNVRPDLSSEAEMRMRELYARELDRDGEKTAAALWRERGLAHPDSANGRIVRAMLAAEAAAIERAAGVAEGACADMPSHQPVASLIATAIRSLKEGASHVG